METPFDLILRGGHVIDPDAGIDGICDIAVRGDTIAAVGTNLGPARDVVDVSGRLVLPGMIDSHAHVYEHVTGRFGLNPDLVGVRSGVTTLIDMGCASFISMGGFRHFIVEKARSRIFSFISIYAGGEGFISAEMKGAGINVDLCIECVQANRDLVKGVKVNAEIGSMSLYGIDKVIKAKKVASTCGVPLYVHFGELYPPDVKRVEYDVEKIFPDVAAMLTPGDIMAHPFSRHPGGFLDANGKLHPIVHEALAQGVRIDVGHGSHFSFQTARKVLEAGVIPDTLGADLHGFNCEKPVEPGVPKYHPDPEMVPFAGQAKFSLTQAMVELLALGVPLNRVVAMVTSECAKTLRKSGELGTLRPGLPADISVLADERGRWVLRDNEGTEVVTDRMLQPLFCLRAGRQFQVDAEILPIPEAA